MTTEISLPDGDEVRAALAAAARERILILDGAMGTMIQALKLDEAGYRGERFKDWHRDVRGNNDLLILTQPDAIRDIHLQYFLAGADISRPTPSPRPRSSWPTTAWRRSPTS